MVLLMVNSLLQILVINLVPRAHMNNQRLSYFSGDHSQFLDSPAKLARRVCMIIGRFRLALTLFTSDISIWRLALCL